MYEQDLALNNLQWLMCHETKPNQINVVIFYSAIAFPIKAQSARAVKFADCISAEG